MNPFLQNLESGRILVADGATGTNLQGVGLKAGGHTEDWIFEHPEHILELERDFVEAGSQIILTCTFGGTRIRMQGSQYADRVEGLNEAAARLARRAADGSDVLVAGSMGPLGKLLQPYGPVVYPEAKQAYSEQARGLVAGGVDLLIVETQFSLDEARAAFEGARVESDLPIIVSFSYDRGTRTMMGAKPADAARTFAELGAAMVGVNCGTSLENAGAVVTEYAHAAPGYPIWAKPNAGLPRIQGSTTVYDVTPAGMADFATSAIGLGARVVGGCCGSTPAHVRAIAEAVSRLSRVA